MPDISLEECPHCATQQVSAEFVSQMEIDADPNSPNPEQQHTKVWNTFWICRLCNEGIVIKMQSTHRRTEVLNPAQLFGDPRRSGYEFVAIHPKIQKLEAPDHLPEGISRDFNEAQDSLRRRNWTSAGMMFRKVLQRATTAIAGPEMTLSHNLLARIDMLAERHLMTPTMREWAHVIRLDGNEAAHEEDQVFTEQQATQMRDFTELLLIYMFTLPARVQAHREQAERSPSQ